MLNFYYTCVWCISSLNRWCLSLPEDTSLHICSSFTCLTKFASFHFGFFNSDLHVDWYVCLLFIHYHRILILKQQFMKCINHITYFVVDIDCNIDIKCTIVSSFTQSISNYILHNTPVGCYCSEKFFDKSISSAL